MFPNIFAAMASHNRMTIKQLSKETDISEKALSMKLNRKTDFKLGEMQKIQHVLADKTDGSLIPLDILFKYSYNE